MIILFTYLTFKIHYFTVYFGFASVQLVKDQPLSSNDQVFDMMKDELMVARDRNDPNKKFNSDQIIEVKKREIKIQKGERSRNTDSTLNKAERDKLIQAVNKNDLQTLKQLINEKYSVKLLEEADGMVLVHIAAKKGYLDMVKYLLDEPSFTRIYENSNYTKPTKLKDESLTILDDAIFGDSLELVKYLLDRHQINLYESKDFERLLFTMVTFGRLNMLKYFFDERKVKPNSPCMWTSEPIIYHAVRSKQYEVRDYLLNEKKVDIAEERNYLEENILFPAAEVGDLAFIKHLLDEKKMDFDINWTNVLGRPVLYAAVAENQFEVVKYLVEEKQADVNIPTYLTNNHNTTCLHKAIINKNCEISQYLIEHGARMEAKDTYGHVKNPEIIKLLDMALATTEAVEV